jgi:hypothetical protein
MSVFAPITRPVSITPGWSRNDLWRTARAVPSLDLNFSANKSLVDTVTGQNLITFTRASTGTYVGSDGLIKTATNNEPRFDHNPTTGESLGLLMEEARTNNQKHSEDFSQGLTPLNATLSLNQETAPDGNQTADRFLETTANGLHSQEIADFLFVLGTTYTFSCFAKSIGGRTFCPGFPTRFGTARFGRFSLTGAGSVLSTDTGVTASIQAYPNGWYRCSITSTCSEGGGARVGVFIGSGTSTSYAGDETKGLYLWGAQLETAAGGASAPFPTSYIPTRSTFISRASTATYYNASGVIQTAAINEARSAAFLPDSSGVMRPIGLLLEEQRTNLLVQSEDFSTTWVATRASISTNAITAPNGAITANKLVGNATLDSHYVQQNTSGATNGIAYTSSVFAKAGELTRFELLHAVGATLYVQGYDLSDGTLLTRVTPGTTAATGGFIQAVGNGWYRCGITQISDGTTVAIRCTLRSADTVVFDATSQGIFLWGAQIEAGSFPTSYIPTTTAAVTRSADVSSSAAVTRSADMASISGSNFLGWFNATEGTLFGQWIRGYSGNFSNFASSAILTNNLSGANAGSIPATVTNGANMQLYQSIVSSGVEQLDYVFENAGVRNKCIQAYQLNNAQMAINGVLKEADTSCTVPTGIDRCILGMRPASNWINSHLSRITYWPTRLPGLTLQSVTL